MTDRRSGPPLFDLMRERGDRPQAPKPQQNTPSSTPAAPAQTPAPKPAASAPAPAVAPARQERSTAWDTSGGVSRAERSAAAMLDEEPHADSGITLSIAKFYTLIAIALVLIVGAWAGGYQIGYGDGKDEMAQFLPDQPVVSPQGNQASTNQPVVNTPTTTETAQPETRRETSPQNNPGSTPTQTRSPGDIMVPNGFRADDPRTPGMNYLALATLPTEQASDAINFMRLNGVTVIGVPVLDSGSNRANNPSRYSLYSLGLAIPGNQWSAMSNQRLEHQQMIRTLGARWQQERRGGSDFSQTNWEKYDP